MDRQEQIKRIAEGLYPTKVIYKFSNDYAKYPAVCVVGSCEYFNPYESEADAFKLLEDLLNYDDIEIDTGGEYDVKQGNPAL